MSLRELLRPSLYAGAHLASFICRVRALAAEAVYHARRGYSFTSYSAACYSPFMNRPIKSIKIAIPHRLSRQEATRRLQSGFADFRKQYASNLAQMEDRWTGDHMDFKATAFGQLITGRIDVRDSSVDVEVDLPWLFAVLAEKVKGQLQQAGHKLLEKK
jgi:hypothetical protein